MPTFKFESPDGKTYSVDGPEGATKEQAFQILQQSLGGAAPPAAPQEGIAADVGKSVATGLAKGTAAAVGLPGDLATLAHAIAPQGVIDRVKAIPGAKAIYDHLPTSQAIEDHAKANDTSLADLNYQSQTAPGRYAGAIAKTAGPGLATGMGIPATLASAVAGQGAYDLTGSHLAEAGASLAGGIAAPAIMAARARRASMPLISGPQLKADAQAIYNGPELSSAIVSQQSLKDLALNTDQMLARRQFDPEAIGEVRKIIDNRWHGANQPQTIADLQNSRSRLGELAKGAPTTQTTAAGAVKRELDSYLNNIAPNQIVSGDPQRAASLLRRANSDYHAQSSAKAVDDLIGNAITDNNAANSAMNLGNRIRQSFKPLLKNDAAKLRQMGHGDDIIDAVSMVNKGDPTTNLLRHASNMLGGGGGIAATIIGHGAGSAVGGAVGYQQGGIGGLLGGAALGAAGALPGQGLRLLANARTEKMARRVTDSLLAKAPANASIVRANRAARAANKAAMERAITRGGIPAAAMMLSKFNNGG